MKIQGRWKSHLIRGIAGLAALLILGWATGAWKTVFLSALVLYLCWHVLNLARLYLWLQDKEKDPPESIGIWADLFDQIHELQKSNSRRQARYQEAIEEFQGMTDAFPDAALVIDQHDNITWFNDAAHQLLGLRAPEDLRQPVTNLLREPDFAGWLAVEDQVQSQFEMASPMDSNIYLAVNAVRYRGDQRLLILRNVTEVHNLEQVRQDFVANVSHELRTPLTVLLGYLEVMREDCPEGLEMAVGKMHGQAVQMQNLLNDLLELSRLQADLPESGTGVVDVPAMLENLEELSGELDGGNHELHFEVEPGLNLLGNAIDLESAFRNLVNNALHYTPEGGSIQVNWSGSPDGPVLSVRDSGIGIPARDLSRLTERFYRVGSDRSRHTGGTGLGLAIVKHVLNTHDARLVIESELGEGSVFSCVFPAERQEKSGPTRTK